MFSLKIKIQLFLLFTCSFAWGQNKVIPLDQAIQKLDEINSPVEKCEFTIEQSNNYFMYMKRKESLEMSHLGLKIAVKNDLNEYEIPLLINVARVHETLDQLDSSLYYSRISLNSLSDKTEELRGKVYSFLGRQYQYSGKLDSMAKYYDLTEDWNRQNDPYRNWVLYEQWHKLYNEIGDYTKAKELLDKAYEITKPKAKRMDHGMLLYRYRMLANRIGDMDMYAKYTKEYYDLVGNNVSSAHGFDLGQDLSVKEKISKYQSLFASNKKIAFDLGSQAYYPTITSLYLKDNQTQNAFKYWSKIDTVGNDLQYKSDYEEMGIFIFEKRGDFKRAYTHLQRKVDLDKALQNEEKLKQVEEFNIKYETIQKEQEVALLASQNEIKELELVKAKQNRYMLLLGLAIASFFAIWLGYMYILNKRKKKELETKNQIIEAALNDKNILLREIHHRVKNNLQVVSSLLNLQSNYISDNIALEAINEGKNRVSSMALIHQNLYQEENLTGINCKEYFEDLIDSLFDSYNVNEGAIQLKKDVSDLNLDVETMVPLGLIVNELISNALKHAFVENDKQGKINFFLGKEGNVLILKVEDNGKGMNSENFLSSKSFGNKLIQAFKQKLGATIEIENNNGTSFTIYIHKYKIAA